MATGAFSGEKVSDGKSGLLAAQHTDLDPSRRKIHGQLLQRGSDQVGDWSYRVDADRRLHRQRRDACRTEETVCGKDLQVRRHPGTRGRIEPRNGQSDLDRCTHKAIGITMDGLWKTATAVTEEVLGVSFLSALFSIGYRHIAQA